MLDIMFTALNKFGNTSYIVFEELKKLKSNFYQKPWFIVLQFGNASNPKGQFCHQSCHAGSHLQFYSTFLHAVRSVLLSENDKGVLAAQTEPSISQCSLGLCEIQPQRGYCITEDIVLNTVTF